MSRQSPILFDYWRSSASYRVRIALALKGIKYDTIAVDLLSGAHEKSEHRARNPQGLVPALSIDGEMLTQSLAIIEYLEETRPGSSLLPADAAGRARVRALADAIAMEVHPVCNLSVVRHVAALTGGGEDVKAAWMQRFITNGLEAFEALLDHSSTGMFCHGDTPGLVECCLVPQLYNAHRWGVNFTDWPRISRISQACATLRVIECAHPEHAKPR